jgi:hypothetical protein
MLADGGFAGRRAEVRPMSTPTYQRTGSSEVRHVVEVRVTGDMDIRKATAQIRQLTADVSRNEVDAADRFQRVMARD